MIIRLKNLQVQALVGIHEHEKKKRQPIYIQVKFELMSPPRRDDIKSTVDYEALSKQIEKYATHRHFNLVETMAQGVLDLLMGDTRIRRAMVEIDKPQALKACENVSVVCSAAR